ncbi:MAG: glycoside hydrolase family 3 protein [Lachnospiraceae bacterium]|nr:glycoside hydrolase family 3 protein [Lachnospiraceae bacterium]
MEDKISQMMMLSFRGWGEDECAPVPELNDVMERYLRETHPGGVVLFRENCRDAEQTLRLTTAMQEANRAGESPAELMIATDQEGGMVTRISYGTAGPGNRALADTGKPENAYRMGQIIGRELQALGINADLAPVADLSTNPANPIIGARSFGEDPLKTEAFVIAFQKGLHSEKIISTLKHFPGHGNTEKDSHILLPRVESSTEELWNNELIPFRGGIRHGADMVMMAHIQYPRLEKACALSLKTGKPIIVPATMSEKIIRHLLRGRLGFEGVVLSDALEMKAVSTYFHWDDVFAMMINAGVNMMLMPAIFNECDLVTVEMLRQRILSMTLNGRIRRERIEDSAGRILELKERYGLLDGKEYGVDEAAVLRAKKIVGCESHQRAVRKMLCDEGG